MLNNDPLPMVPTALSRILWITGSALLYFYAFKLNFVLFDWLEFSDGVNWIFLPSGLRLLLVLVLMEMGALGISMASIALMYVMNPHVDHVFAVVTGLISGGAPLLARKLSVDLFKLSTSLEGLNSAIFFKLTVLFALTSALMHQLWFYWYGQTTNFIASACAMLVGDWFGTVLVLATASWLIKLFRRPNA